jgi:hypothetical protein
LIDLEGKAGRKLYDVPLRGLSEDGGLWLDLVALDPSMGVVGWIGSEQSSAVRTIVR